MTESLYKTHEIRANNNFMLYPMNSLSSMFYLFPAVQIAAYSYTGVIILTGLTVASTLWWGKQTETMHHLDLFFLSSTLIWALSFINYHYELLYITPFLLLQKNKLVYNKIIVISMILLMLSNISNYIRSLYILAVTAKISDTYLGNPYGTALFHVISSITLVKLIQSKI